MEPLLEETVDKALSLIRDEPCLPHPLGKLLSSFITQAVDPPLAAAHVLSYCHSGQHREAELRALVSDWTFIIESITKHGTTPPAPDSRAQTRILKRDGNRCCITGKPASLSDPLVVMPVVLAPSRWLEAEPRVLAMLRAFFSPPYLNCDSSGGGTTYNIQARFSVSCMPDVPHNLLGAWLIIPQFIRLPTYKLLRKIGHHLYGSTSSLAVSRLPFGLYLKSTSEGAFNESNALGLIHKYTSVPVPRVLDLVADSRNTYLLTTGLRGEPLARAMDMLSDRDCQEFVDQMQSFISQIRAIPPVGPKNHICNTLGQACSDPRIRDGNPIGPFDDEASFSQYLRHPDDPTWRGHQVVFTHADLNLRNILVDKVTRLDGTRGWAVSGIVDWENSGFYPEYWDCTKAQFEGFRWDERWARALVEVFRPFGGYAKEIELEKRSWTEGDGAFRGTPGPWGKLVEGFYYFLPVAVENPHIQHPVALQSQQPVPIARP
ncbi:hypothetical protein FocTR4_00015526 [Fusarium oxysporum f. sp. cubense]|uniref:Aminoglycoside phosphotransferase domain-containing protein n=1 Tax=Fusarium oxysporum f. sp. cubense TaxID=61366 RepID=A0A5C6SVT2_FUSOC|nr:hypothetical protein FocTR4_00015526 [Fusarium oxysporum f. sp. cubense]